MGQDESNPLDQIASAAVNYLTVGLVGVKDGKLDKGVLTRGADEALGEVTGRNAARKLAFEQKDALVEEKAAKVAELKGEATKRQQQDVAASNFAGAVRSTSAARRRQSLGQPTIQTDFLGL